MSVANRREFQYVTPTKLQRLLQFSPRTVPKLPQQYFAGVGLAVPSRSAGGNIGALARCMLIQAEHEMAFAIVCISTLYIRCNTHTLDGRCSSSPRDD